MDEVDRQVKKLEEANESLRGLFDAVVILATFQTEDGDTITVQRGSGNWQARAGMLDYAMIRSRVDIEEQARKEAEE